MPRRLNLSTPTVIQTELHPLDESFWIEAYSNQEVSQIGFEQWYYDNTNVYQPDRNLTPLVLVAKLTATDPDTHIAYNPNLITGVGNTSWYVTEWDYSENDYVEYEVTARASTDSVPNAPYYIDGADLVVKKNVLYSHAVMIRCKGVYADPRDAGITHIVLSETVTLSTNRDATPVYPEIDVMCPASQSYNPLVDDMDSKFNLRAVADWSAVAPNSIVPYKAVADGTEENFPHDLQTVSPILDIAYGDTLQENQVFSMRPTANGELEEIPANTAFVKKVVGNTVKIVQLVNPAMNRSDVIGVDFNGVTTTYNSTTKKYHIQGTASANYDKALNNGLSVVNGHKYLLISNSFPAGQNTDLSLYCYVSGFTIYNKTIVTSSVNASNINMWAFVKSGNTVSFDFNINIYDLTLMFGAGNEPTTVEEFETWLANNVGLKDYIPYTAGKLVNFGGYSVKMNQLCEFTLSSETENNGITFTPQSDKSVLLNGTATSLAQVTIGSLASTNGHKYYLKAAGSGSSGTSDVYVNWNLINAHYFYSVGEVYSCEQNSSGTIIVRVSNGKTCTNRKVSVIIIDLTLMFGAGNEPTLEECNAIFTKDYYPYNTGTSTNILDVMGKEVGMKTTGFNQWDEEWQNGYYDSRNGRYVYNPTYPNHFCCKNLIPVFSEKAYYITRAASFCFYDANKNFISSTNDTTSITTPSNARYITFTIGDYGTTYNHDICINISDPSRNGTYEAHWEAIRSMDWVRNIGIKNFNIWDEQWEINSDCLFSKNFIPVKAGTTYYKNIPSTSRYTQIYFYDSSFNQVSSSTGATSGEFTIDNGIAYIKFSVSSEYGTTYNNDICINESVTGMNGTYVPYGETAKYFPYGLMSAGTVHDEIYIDAETGNVKAKRCVGCVDLGDLTWALYQGQFLNQTAISNVRTGELGENIVCSKYVATTADSYSNMLDKEIGLGGGGIDTLRIVDTSYSDATTFKTAINGAMLYYKLATSYEYILDLDDVARGFFEWYAIDDDTEVRVETMPWYVGGQSTEELTVDALYGDPIRIILRARPDASTPLFPNKVYRTIGWRNPDIDSTVVCVNGSAVRSHTENMTFGTVINTCHRTLDNSDGGIVDRHLRLNWKSTDNSVKEDEDHRLQQEVDQGWGKEVTINGSELRHTYANDGIATSSIYPYIYLLGPYELVTDDNDDVVYDGNEPVWDRYTGLEEEEEQQEEEENNNNNNL